jgi:hypothetical protein
LDVVLSGNAAFIANSFGGIHIVDVSIPNQPARLGVYEAVGAITGVALAGPYAYLVGGQGLRVIDISNPGQPTEVGALGMPGVAVAVVVLPPFAYVAVGSPFNTVPGVQPGSLRLVDISNPSRPAEVGAYRPPGSSDVQGVAVRLPYAYIAAGDRGLRVVDVSTPNAPTEVGSYDTLGNAEGIAVDGRHAYVADGARGLRVLDIANPASPTEIGFYDTPGYAQSVAVASPYAYVADRESGLRIINVSNPVQPIEVGFLDTPGVALGAAVLGPTAYVVDYGGGVRLVDISNPAHPAELSADPYSPQGYPVTYANGIAVAGPNVYVAGWDSGFVVMKFVGGSQPPTPTIPTIPTATLPTIPSPTAPIGTTGGHNFSLEANHGGPVVARWTDGTLETGYLGLGIALPSSAVSLFPSNAVLPANATSFVDSSPPGFGCYTVLVLGGNPIGTVSYGNSDLICRLGGLATGGPPPSFMVQLNSSNLTTLTWAAAGTQFGTVVFILPTNGSPPSQVSLGPGITAFPHNPSGQMVCYLLLTPTGNTDALCPLPNTSTLATSSAATLRSTLDRIGIQTRSLSVPIPESLAR